jgi:hypothetical protein
MPRIIILTPEQAEAVRGPTGPVTALAPVQLPDARWCLSAAVLADPAHAVHHALLAACPQDDYAPPPAEEA